MDGKLGAYQAAQTLTADPPRVMLLLFDGATRFLRQALKALPEGGSSRLILLVTDGEDQDSFPLDAAKEAAKDGVRIVAIGFGDEKGSEIQITDPATGARRVVTDRAGNVVKTRLDGETLRQIALATQGAYVPAGTAMLDLPSIVAEHIEPLAREQSAQATRRVPVEHYPWFVMISLGAVCAAAWTQMTPRRRAS